MTLTHERLQLLINYDSATGIFTRRIRTAHCNRAGDIIGSPDRHGHLLFYVDGRKYLAHRLAWLYVYRRWPKTIDHINGIPYDNRITNLRECTQAQNTRNKCISRRNTSGFKGVSRCRGRWNAKIMHDGTAYSLGCYDTPQEAADAYDRAAMRLQGEFARINQSLR